MGTRRRSGFTLLEMVVALVLVSLVLGAISTSVVQTQRELTRQRNLMKAEETVGSLEVLIIRLLRNGRADPKSVGATVGKIDFNPQGRATWDNVRVRSDYNPADGSVAGDLEDVLVDKLGDTVFVRWKVGATSDRFAYPIKVFKLEGYKLDGTAVTDATQSDAVQKVKLTVEVPKSSSSSTDLLRRERWIYMRN